MKPGTKVRLITFNGTSTPPPGCKPQENYWALIGSGGTIVEFHAGMARYLVQFDTAVRSLGLACHNPVPNSLYIQGGDIVVAESGANT